MAAAMRRHGSRRLRCRSVRVTAFAQGTWTLEEIHSLVIGRDSGGLFAYSASCTHTGCLLNAPDRRGVATCPCHGSVFDGSGSVVRGPASSPLQHFLVTVQGGTVTVDPTMPVNANARTPV